MMYCSNCGKQQNSPSAVYCYSCGYKLVGDQGANGDRPVEKKKRLVLSAKGEELRKKLVNEGVVAALLVGGVTAIFATLSVFGVSLLGASPWLFVDAGIFLLLGYGIYRGNKYAAVAAFTLYIAESFNNLAEAGRSGTGGSGILIGWVVVGVLIRAFYRGMKGTLAYTEGYSFAIHSSKKLKPLVWLTAACVVVGFIGAVTLYTIANPSG